MVSIASIPHREESLRRVVASLLAQTERLNVYLNEYGHIPEFLQHPKIAVTRSQDHGDRGDAGKFFWLGTDARYFLTCDDDIVYPPDYVEQTIASIERYGRRAVIGWHGSILADSFRDYYEDRKILSFYLDLERDTSVHILGTGTVGFHVSTIRLALVDFKVPNMADVWFGLKGQEQSVPFIVRAHRAGELVPILDGAQDTAIWRDCVDNADSGRNTRSAQNDVVLAHWPWTIHACQTVPRASSGVFWLVLGLLGAATLLGAGITLPVILLTMALVTIACGLRRVWLRWRGKTRN